MCGLQSDAHFDEFAEKVLITSEALVEGSFLFFFFLLEGEGGGLGMNE